MSSASSQKSPQESTVSASRRGTIQFERDIVAVVETNVDDVTGEVLGRTVEKALNEGAHDATVSAYLGKKGRMGQTVRIVCSTDSIEKFAQLLVEETGTLGVKTTEYTRLMIPRRVVSVPVAIESFKGNVSVKVVEVRGKLRIKPELSDAKQISDSQRIPLRDVLELICLAARQYLASEPRPHE